MAYDRDKDIVFRALYESPILSMHDYCCHIARSGPGVEEESDANNIVLMRHGAFARHFGRRTATADVSVFYRTLRQSHFLASPRAGATARVCGFESFGAVVG